MNIAVLVKQVPSVSDIELDPKTNNLVRIGAPSMLNPVDLHAIEAALAVKDSVGGTVTLISMGMATAADAMRDGIAMGADKGVLVSDERMAGSDTLATGKILAKAIEKIGSVDLVFTGRQSTDGDTGQIPPAVAQRLGMSLLTYAEEVETTADGLVITRKNRGGTEKVKATLPLVCSVSETANLVITRKNRGGTEKVKAPLPLVCSVSETANTPRSANIRGKMNAKKAVFDTWRLEDLGLAPEEAGKAGSATAVAGVFAPEKHTVGIMIEGADEKADRKNIQ